MSSIFNRFISLDIFKKSKSPTKSLKMSEEIINSENGSQPQEQAPAPEANSEQNHQEVPSDEREEIVVEPQADTKPDDVGAKQTDDQTANQTLDHTRGDIKENQEGPQESREKVASVGTSTTVVIENQEVVSSTTASRPSKPAKSRRASYQASRSYAGSFQNYGLAYLPYKSNFEPSEDARRRADEFLKTLKL